MTGLIVHYEISNTYKVLYTISYGELKVSVHHISSLTMFVDSAIIIKMATKQLLGKRS